jgi:hypothetical protein
MPKQVVTIGEPDCWIFTGREMGLLQTAYWLSRRNEITVPDLRKDGWLGRPVGMSQEEYDEFMPWLQKFLYGDNPPGSRRIEEHLEKIILQPRRSGSPPTMGENANS